VSECPAGCCPHDGVSLGEGCPRDLPDAPLPERVAHLRACQLLPAAKIAAVTGVDRRSIVRLLYEVTTSARPRGAWRRRTREADGDEWLGQVMAHLTGQDRIPVTRTGAPSARGPSELELLGALYADPKVRRVLDRHGVPVVTLTEPAWRRFPAPQPLSTDLVSDLYAGCGLSLHHIELLTGRPAAAVGAVLRVKGIPLRRAGRSSPFLRRWRQAQE
jgi:hypothetical protein